jgi:hypothetical protein
MEKQETDCKRIAPIVAEKLTALLPRIAPANWHANHFAII